MARSKDEVNQLVKRYSEMASTAFKIDGVYLFGSYAYGKPNKYSDIDVALVSPDFEYIPEDSLLKILFKMARHVDAKIEPVALTPDELQHPALGTVVVDIAQKGLRIR